MSARSIVELPGDLNGDYEVYLNGVLQQAYVDFDVEGRTLVFSRPLRKSRDGPIQGPCFRWHGAW